VKIAEVKSRKVYYDGWCRWAYEVESEDLMKNHWDCFCFKAKTTTMAENAIPSVPEPAYISPMTYQSSNCKSDTGEIFISSLYAKQNNLLDTLSRASDSSNPLVWLRPYHLNQGTTIRLRDGVKITFV